MAFLSLVITVVAIFIGQGKGILAWVVGSISLIVLGGLMGLRHAPPTPQEVPIIIAGMAVVGTAIMVGQWKGLLFWFLGSIVVVLCVLFGLL